ncbi:hypothetical protein AB7W72_23505, partial [Providencia rettgeri]
LGPQYLALLVRILTVNVIDPGNVAIIVSHADQTLHIEIIICYDQYRHDNRTYIPLSLMTTIRWL